MKTPCSFNLFLHASPPVSTCFVRPESSKRNNRKHIFTKLASFFTKVPRSIVSYEPYNVFLLVPNLRRFGESVLRWEWVHLRKTETSLRNIAHVLVTIRTAPPIRLLSQNLNEIASTFCLS